MTNYRHAYMIDLIAKVNSPMLSVHTERCLLVRNRNAECLKCAAVCTSGAITLAEEGIRIEPALCIGCGTCASACPTCCLETNNPSDDELFSTACRLLRQNHGRLIIACSSTLALSKETHLSEKPAGAWMTENGEEALAVTCLGRIDESFLVEAVACGAREILLISDACVNCAQHTGGELFSSICRNAENLMNAFGATPPFKRIIAKNKKLQPMQNEPCPTTNRAPEKRHDSATATTEKTDDASGIRHQNHSALTRGGKRADGKFVHVQSDGTLPHFLPQRRLRLFNSLKELGSPVTKTVSTRLWGQVSLNADLCRSCRMCTVFCPTGALSRFDTAEGAFGIDHRSTLCMQCNLCESICPEKAIRVSDVVSLEAFATGRKKRIELQPLGWEPGTENSIPTRMARFIKTDTFQDPQAKMKPNLIAEQRSYADQKQHIRNQKKAEENI